MTDKKAANQEAQAAEGAVQEEKAVVAAPDNKPVVASGANYIAVAIQAKQQGFLEANEGLDLDYVRMGQYLKINKKGNFVEAKDETTSYGDSIDVVIAQGETRWVLWGKDESPEKGQLIISVPAKQNGDPTAGEKQARAMLDEWLMHNPQAAERYEQDDLQMRYTAFIVPVKSITPDDAPKIYLMTFAPGDTYGWGNYAMNIYDGKYKAIGVPGGMGANKVVTRLTTEDRKRPGSTDSYLGLVFECLGAFNPADYGIQV